MRRRTMYFAGMFIKLAYCDLKICIYSLSHNTGFKRELLLDQTATVYNMHPSGNGSHCLKNLKRASKI